VLSRRQFLAALAATFPAAVPVRTEAFGVPGHLPAGPRALRFAHTHTGEHLSIEYFGAEGYRPDALATINHLLRDFRTGEVHDIDAGLLDLLYRLTRLTESDRPFEVISGYRSPVTNQRLRQRSEGVAAGSLHMKGMAIDIRLADVPLASLRKAALSIGGGGVGYYPASNFVHVDTGRVRFW
jgi:uncharacterized protein YcbK (DUF882 family)